jgi:hypothetical protein
VKKRQVIVLVLAITLTTALLAPLRSLTVRAQDGCGDAPPTRLTVGGNGAVTFTDGQPLNVRQSPGLTVATIGQLPEGTGFIVVEGPVCADSVQWWHIQGANLDGWVAEGMAGEYFVAPVNTGTPLASGTGPFVDWNWAALGDSDIPDPKQIVLPAVYAGDLPALPVDLSTVQFVDDAQLNEAQRALLAQNGFVVVPAGFAQFVGAYHETETWWSVPPGFDMMADPGTPQPIGHGNFVTTDATLHALHYIFDNLLTDLELLVFQPVMVNDVLVPTLQTAHQQTAEAPAELSVPAQNAELFLVVAVELFQPGAAEQYTSPELFTAAQPLIQQALAGEGRAEIPFLPNYEEDFSQYRPRGHYEDDPQLEQYFRGMMWVSRITFLVDDPVTTQTALLLLRALRATPDALDGWTNVHDTLSFLIGPVDDLGPQDYSPLADAFFGPNLPLAALADLNQVAGFQAQANLLPGPRINGLILPDDTTAEEVVPKTRGFRFLGQRFTFDGFVMQQLMYPYVGTPDQPRLLPLGLDISVAVGGSDTAYRLAIEAGAGDFANYDVQTLKLASSVGLLTDDLWLENVYGGWLWALRPLWTRDFAAYPPMMSTEAWLRKDIQSGLASWTQLKHDTVLYAKQPTGFGGGGPPLSSYGYVEPNPLVFARIAVVAAMTYEGLTQRGYGESHIPERGSTVPSGEKPGSAYLKPDTRQPRDSLTTTMLELRRLAYESATFAEVARKELAGEPFTEDEYWAILLYGEYLSTLLRTLWQSEGAPDPVALVTDVANNPSIQSVLQEAVGGVDYIYVVVPNPHGGTQLVRGGVFSYYEWVGNIDQRMTDSEWRAQVAAGNLPARPTWTDAFYSK